MDKENKEDLHLKDLFTGTVMERVDKTIKYIQKNAGAFSLISTVIIALGSVVIKLIYYLSDLGYAYYFGISKELIDVSKGNIIYSFFVDGVMALFVAILNFIPYLILKSYMKRFRRIGYLLILILATALILSFIDFLRGVKYGIYDIISVIIASTVLYSLGISFFLILKKDREDTAKDKKNQKKVEKKTKEKIHVKFFRRVIIFVGMIVVIEAILIIAIGWMTGKGLNEFKVLEDLYGESDYAVIYETSDSFIITQCEIDEEKNTIKFVELARKKEIDKKEVEYTEKILTQVKD